MCEVPPSTACRTAACRRLQAASTLLLPPAASRVSLHPCTTLTALALRPHCSLFIARFFSLSHCSTPPPSAPKLRAASTAFHPCAISPGTSGACRCGDAHGTCGRCGLKDGGRDGPLLPSRSDLPAQAQERPTVAAPPARRASAESLAGGARAAALQATLLPAWAVVAAAGMPEQWHWALHQQERRPCWRAGAGGGSGDGSPARLQGTTGRSPSHPQLTSSLGEASAPRKSRHSRRAAPQALSRSSGCAIGLPPSLIVAVRCRIALRRCLQLLLRTAVQEAGALRGLSMLVDNSE